MADPVPFIETFRQTLVNIGMVQTLTLLMMIVITYAVLLKSKLFGDANDATNKKDSARINGINMLVSLIVGFLVFISPVGRVVDFWFSTYFIQILIVLATLLGIALIAGMAGFEFGKLGDKDKMLIKMGALGIGLLIFFNAGGLGLFNIQPDEFGNFHAGIVSAITSWDLTTVGNIAGVVIMLGLLGIAFWVMLGGKPKP